MSLSQGYFDDLYRADADPWRFESRSYEARKRALTVACLPDERYQSAVELGCSTGALTTALAARCDHLVATDISPLALEIAARRVPSNVELRLGGAPDHWPSEPFDLVVISEMGYYLDRATLARLATLAVHTTRDLVAVHWRHLVSDYPLTGDEVHDVLGSFADDSGMTRLVAHQEADFKLDLWSHDPRSVAERSGIVDP